MTDWHVGMKVVCVNAFDYADAGQLQEGSIYTVMAIIDESHRHDDFGNRGGLGIDLLEAPANRRRYWKSWYVGRFRPLCDANTDISIFRKLIEPSELVKFKESVKA